MPSSSRASTATSFWRKPHTSRIRKILFLLHLWLGLTVGLLASVTCLTGAMVVYKPEIERAQMGRSAHIAPLPADTGAAPSLQAGYDLVRRAYPLCAVTQAYLHGENNLAWSFDLNCKAQGRVVVYYDPYRRMITGEDRFEKKWTQWIYDLHVHLLAGRTGETVNGYGGLLLMVLAGSGLAVWWPGAGLWRNGFRYAWRAGWRRQNYDLHRLLGFAASGLLVLLAFTGAYFAFPKTYEGFASLLGRGPSVQLAPRTAAGTAHPMNLDVLYATAVQAMPLGQSTLWKFPQQPTAPYSLRKWLPGDWRRTGDNLVYLDRYTGKVLRVTYHRDLPRTVRLVRDIYPVHFGTFGGTATRLVWIVVGVAPAVLYVTGLLMWWNRWLRRRTGALLQRRQVGGHGNP